MTEPKPARLADLVCSARRCHDGAQWGLLWNNPRLHTPERRKVWLACEAHVEYLSEFLEIRGFLRSVVPVSELSSKNDVPAEPVAQPVAV